MTYNIIFSRKVLGPNFQAIRNFQKYFFNIPIIIRYDNIIICCVRCVIKLDTYVFKFQIIPTSSVSKMYTVLGFGFKPVKFLKH